MKPNTAITYSPYTKKFYEGSWDQDGTDFSRDYGMTALARLNLDADVGDGRIDPINYETFRQAERDFKSGNIDSTSLNNITVVDLLEQVVRKEWRDFNAINGVRRIPVPRLQLDIPITNKFSANKKVPELAQADQKSNTFTQAQLRLWKNVVSIMESDESVLKANINPLEFEIEQASGSLAQSANEQIVTEIESGLATQAGGDWGAMVTAGDFSNRNPLNDLVEAVDTIVGNHFRPDTCTMSPRVISDYQSNTYIHASTRPDTRQISGVFPLDKMPNINTIVDVGFTNTVACVYDKRGALLGEGATVAESFRDVFRASSGYVVRQYLQPKIATSDIGVKITGVSA
mgnify:CR=1 FL=1|tara:strand:- start:1854 stop:2888 length:1035 start_codon:yes stop_codon:yes gene_type:complete